MLQFYTDRRINRSDNLHQALELQLASTSERAQIEALALADAQGFVMAAVGDGQITEEIAAKSPDILNNNRLWQGKLVIRDREWRLTVSAIESPLGHYYLCAAGGLGATIRHELFLSTQGIDRILSAPRARY